MKRLSLLLILAFIVCAWGGAIVMAVRLIPAIGGQVSTLPERPKVEVRATRVSHAPDGTPANAPSTDPTLSADGQTLIFTSSATNLVPDDTNNQIDFFAYDAATDTLTWLSVAKGQEADSWVQLPMLAADGSGFSFASRATNLVANDPNGIRDVFWHDLTTGETTLVSRTNEGEPLVAEEGAGGAPAWGSMDSDVSSDGEWVLFTSTATNLAAPIPCTFTTYDLNSCTHTYLHHRATGETIRISTPRFCPLSAAPCNPTRDDAFDGAIGSVDAIAISADGRFSAFDSNWEGLVADDTVRACLPRNVQAGTGSSCSDLFLYDHEDGTLTLISRLPDGVPIQEDVTNFTLSADGQIAVMEVGFGTLYWYDHATERTHPIPLPEGHRGSNPVLAGDGKSLIFTMVRDDETLGTFRYLPEGDSFQQLDLPALPVNISPYALNHDGTVLAVVLRDGRGDQGSGSNENLYRVEIPSP